jgi:hypothetical protein
VKLSAALFLAGYYANNLVNCKIRGRFVRKTVREKAHEWNELHEAHSGRDAWLVVGNGPSLTTEDLESLGHLPSVASNKINLLYERTDWRPTLYTIVDAVLLHKLRSEYYENLPPVLLPNTVFHMAATSRKLPWKFTGLDEGIARFANAPGLPDPVDSGLIDGRTVTVNNIQLAMWCGAKTVYIIGCDHNYKEQKTEKIAKLSHENENNHFHKDYRKPGEIVNNASIGYMDRGYHLMRRIAENNGIRIVNITRKTALEAYEKGTVEEAVAATR